MSSFEALEQQFKKLEEEHAKSHEERFKQRQEQEGSMVKLANDREKLVRAVTPMPKFEQGELDRLNEFDKAALDKYLKTVRPTLVNRPPSSDLDAKRLAFLNGLQIPGMRRATPFAASLLTGEPVEPTGAQAERVIPAVKPWGDPGRIDISLKRQGSTDGWCGAARPAVFPKTVVVWFPFLADETTTWNLAALINFHGFWTLTLYPHMCKFCEVKLDVTMDVYQYFWNGTKRFSLINKRRDGLSSRYTWNEFYDQPHRFEYDVQLKADNAWWVFVRIEISLWVDVYGYNSYGELNFESGDGNYIYPIMVVATTP